MNPVWLVCGSALALDVGAVTQALGSSAPGSLFAWCVAHSCASALFCAAFARAAPVGPAASPRDALVLAFCVAFFLPVAGMVGLLTLITPTLYLQTLPVPAPVWGHPVAPSLSGAGMAGALQGPGDARNLDAMLRDAPDPQTRMDALMGTLKLADAQAAVLLRRALKDRDDEVRLLAYALLDRKEKAIEARIHTNRLALETLADGAGFAQHRALAYDFWELSLLGTTQVGAPSPLSTYVCEHARAALHLEPHDAGLQLLLGRALLRERELEGAAQALQCAVRCGMAPARARPYLAEIAYLQQRYAQVKHLRQSQGLGASHAPLENVWKFWEGVRHGTAKA